MLREPVTMTTLATTDLPTLFARFRRDRDGAVAIIFTLVSMVLLLITGLAIDLGRAMHASGIVSAALDAAALAGAKGVRLQNLPNEEVNRVAKAIFDSNLLSSGGSYAVIKSFNVAIDRPNSSVTVTVDADVPTVFGQLAGVDTLPIPREAIAIFDAKDVEVGLQLDVTGSMRGSKLADLKLATKDLVDILIPDEPTGQKVRIGYAPFSAGVNAGAMAFAVNGGRASNGCVYERSTSSYQTSDATPVGPARLRIAADLANPQPCPSARVLGLTDNKDTLKNTVDSYRDGGTTAGHLGTAWAWYLVSPEWGGVLTGDAAPAAYGDGRTIKVAILMTDGEYNTYGGVMNGANVARSSNSARDTCSAMKTKGVIVYTVGFQLGGGTARDVMSSCASSSSKAYSAENGLALREAFRSIAADIATLRLSK